MALYLLGIFMGAIDTGIITPARTIVANDLGVDDAAGIWMITIYTLAYAAAIPVMGKLADRQGRKRIYLVSIALFGIGSLLCGLSQDVGSFAMLIGARALQAIGGGGILPIATAEIGSEVPAEKRGMALGLVGMVYGVANIFGASAGSLILDVVGTHNWQWIFYVNVPIALAIVVAGWIVLPDHRVGEVKPIDLLGTVLLVGMILSLLYGLRNIDFFDLVASVQDPQVWPYLLGFVVALPLFVLAERRAQDPVLNLAYFTDRGIGLTLVLSLLSGVILMAVVFVPQLAENALRIPSGKGGYFVIVLGLASGIGAPLSGRLTDRFGPKKVLGFGALASAAAAATVVWWMIPAPSLPSVIVSLALIGLGLGFIVGSPLNYMMLERTPASESSSALGTLSLVRSIGTTIAPALMIGFLTHGVAGLQDSLTAELPTSIKAPTLPYAAELTERLNRWKSDEKLADKLAGVELPDLNRTDIEVSTTGGTLPDDLVELLKTADVTNITERTKIVARRMFEEKTPATIADIQNGVDAGLAGLATAEASLDSSRTEMSDGLAEMDTNLSSMAEGLTKMGTALSEMSTGLSKMDTALAGMATGVSKMDTALKGIDAGIAGMTKGVAGLDQAVAGIDTGLAKQKAALAQLEAVPDPTLAGQIAGLKAAIADTQAKRDATAAQRQTLVDKLASTKAQRAELAAQRDKLAAGRATLAAQRAKLAAGRSELATQRSKLATGRSELSQARSDLSGARDSLDSAKAEMVDTVAKMRELRAGVPGAFDQALNDYLAEIDARGPRLEAVFADAVGAGFRGVYLFDLAACLVVLGVIALVPRAHQRPEEEAADVAEPAQAEASLSL